MQSYFRVAQLAPRSRQVPALVKHVVLECRGIPAAKITHEKLKEFAESFCERFNLHIVTNYDHRFSPYGSTIVYVLEESHLAIHSWPEHGYIHCDIVTCAPNDLSFSELKAFISSSLMPKATDILRLRY